MIQCKKCEKEADQPNDLIYQGNLRQEIMNNTCIDCWNEWQNDMEIKVMNEHRVDLSNTEHREFMVKKMREFLNLT